LRGLLCAAACLPAGFGVAVATDVRPLGGLVLVVLALLAVRWSRAELRRQLMWGGVVFACFVASHLLGHVVGSWGAVAIVTVVATGAYVGIGLASGATGVRPVDRRAAGAGLPGA
jgi:hypothetical protein